ncbi:6-phosphogluconate dehydrogenase family protein [Aspergillus karnatakaensis]|uniref:NAD(P)-dependent oxidoreductase n=1 Tax=Aspergillus karnatakaensis TaxID=1810916 RepID=UPI003CCD7BA6
MAPHQIGWFGLGSMGLGMALNLQKHLHANNLPPLQYSNRSLEKGQPLQDAGAIPKADFESVVQSSDIIFTMISNDTVLTTLLTQALSLPSLQGKIFIDTSTIHPDTATAAAQNLLTAGATFIAAPVFGASPVAASGNLIFALAGPDPAIQTVKPYILNVMGRSIIPMGPEPRNSSLLKICGNILVISFMEVISESHVFAEKTGLGTAQLQSFIADMFGPVLESYSERITSGAYAPPLDTPPGFAAALASKDMGHALAIARGVGTRLPTVEVAEGRLRRAREERGEWLDSSAVYGIAREEAGLGFWSERSRQG